ncbi:hypothetical protein FS749_011803 [Ceratobasidium sp. UAMH 11750]|nr:hypothetical protein FS749_011803 [Ceratobasidium sp. UAMH 11750]
MGAVSMLGISVLLSSIVWSCTHVQKLSLPPVIEGMEGTDGEDCPSPQTFLALSDLCALEISLWIFRPESLQALSTLPRLRLLKFIHDGSTTAPLEPVALRENSFPTLKQLYLRQVLWSHVGVVLRHRLLVENLTCLEVITADKVDEWEDIDATLLTLGDIPGLAELVIDFSGFDDHPINPGETLVNVLSQLPLRTVQLVQAQFPSPGKYNLSRTFPVLTELRMPYQLVELNDFLNFATIPNLKYLAVNPWDLRINDLVTNEGMPVCPSLHTLEFRDFGEYSFAAEDVWIVAKYFRRVFPNMKQLIWPKRDMRLVSHYRMTLLNTCIGVLRERNDTRVRIAEQYGWEVANRLLPDDDEPLGAIL